MGYSVRYASNASKALKKIDRYQAKIIIAWIEKNLIGCDNPRRHGKPFIADLKGYWQYRIGVYRLLAVIHDDIVTIEIVNAGHRRDIYK